MGAILVGLGAYLAAVGFRGRGPDFVKHLAESSDLLLWIPAVGGLWTLNQFKATQPIVAPFGAITVLAFILRNEPNISAELKKLYDSVK